MCSTSHFNCCSLVLFEQNVILFDNIIVTTFCISHRVHCSHRLLYFIYGTSGRISDGLNTTVTKSFRLIKIKDKEDYSGVSKYHWRTRQNGKCLVLLTVHFFLIRTYLVKSEFCMRLSVVVISSGIVIGSAYVCIVILYRYINAFQPIFFALTMFDDSAANLSTPTDPYRARDGFIWKKIDSYAVIDI